MSFKEYRDIEGLPKGWNVRDLGECTSLIIDYRGKTPKKLGGDWSEQGYRVLSAKNIKTGKVVREDTIRFLNQELYSKWMKEEVEYEDILLTSEAPLGEVLLWNKHEKIVLGQRLYAIRANKEDIYPRYLYAYMTTPVYKGELDARASGTTVVGIRQSELLKTKVIVPTRSEQIIIGDFFYNIDQKIELNNQMNKTLEEMSQALFKRWFVDFEFPNEDGEPYKSSGGEMVDSELGMIPKGWEVGMLEDLVIVRYGKDHKKLLDGKVPVYGSGGIMRHVDRALYDKESVLIPRKGTLNNVMYVNNPFWSVDTMFFTEMKKENIAKFIFFFMKSKDLLSMNSGSAVPSMTTNILNSLKIIIPNDKVLEKYELVTDVLFKQLEENKGQTENLVKVRDTLLPKLMSGEIRVTDLQN